MRAFPIAIVLGLILSCGLERAESLDPFHSPPSTEPVFFAPGLVTTPHHEHSAPSISPDGNAIYWSAFLAPLQSPAPPVILFTEKVCGRWTKPQLAPFSGQYRDNGPVFSPDGRQIYFYSDRPVKAGGSPGDWDIWAVTRTEKGWSGPYNLGAPVNTTGLQCSPSFTADGTLYYLGYAPGHFRNTAVYRSRQVDGVFQAPELLPETINFPNAFKWCPFVAPDESFLLFSGYQDGGLGAGDICVSFRDDQDRWSDPVNLGPRVNSDDNDRFPALSSDGQWLFFSSKRTDIPAHYDSPQTLEDLLARYEAPGNGLEDIYWMNAAIIDSLRQETLRGKGEGY